VPADGMRARGLLLALGSTRNGSTAGRLVTHFV
jgi:hypothetical protein